LSYGRAGASYKSFTLTGIQALEFMCKCISAIFG